MDSEEASDEGESTNRQSSPNSSIYPKQTTTTSNFGEHHNVPPRPSGSSPNDSTMNKLTSTMAKSCNVDGVTDLTSIITSDGYINNSYHGSPPRAPACTPVSPGNVSTINDEFINALHRDGSSDLVNSENQEQPNQTALVNQDTQVNEIIVFSDYFLNMR